MTPDQVLVWAIVAVVVILAIVGVARGVTRRRGRNEVEFGAGGVPQVAIGTRGSAKTALSPSGVVLAAGEQWTARSASGAAVAEGQSVRVVGQEGLVLIVEPESRAAPTST